MLRWRSCAGSGRISAKRLHGVTGRLRSRTWITDMHFSAAMEPLKDSRRMARRSWVQPGKYVYLEAESVCITPDIPRLRFMATDGTAQVGIQPSHAGLVA